MVLLPVELPAEELSAAEGEDDLDAALSTELAQALRAVAAGRRRPQRALLLHPDPSGRSAHLLGDLAHELGLPLLVRELPRPDRVAAVRTALETLPDGPGHWIWFLAADARPETGALTALTTAARRSSRVGLVGPKLVRADQPRLLRSLGHHLTPAGRVVDPTRAALVDQGQLDLRQDVLGVPLSGSLVASSVLEQVGGIDPAFAQDGVDGLDLGWRAHLAGQRVVVAPDAVVRQGEAGLGVVDPLLTRVRVRQLALARGSAWAAPWRALGVLVTSLAAALVLLLVKRPADAAGEWADVRAVLRPGRGWSARRRFRRRRTVAPRDLEGLHEPRGTGWRATLDTVGDALDPRQRRSGSAAGSRTGALRSGPVSDDFDDLSGGGRRPGRWSWPLALALLLAAAATLWTGRGVLAGLDPAGTGLTGGQLGTATTDAAGLWSSTVDAWRGGGLGHDDPPPAWLPQAAALSWLVGLAPGAGRGAAGPALAWLLAAAPVLSVLTAYLALRRSTLRRWLRAALALGWALAPSLTVAVAQGRVGPAVVHVLAPLLVAGLLVVSDRGPGVRRAAAAFGSVLGLAIAAQWVPLVLVPGTLAGLLVLALGRGSARWRGAVVAVLPWLLLLPWWPSLLAGPVQLLGGAGATSASPALPADPSPWQLLLLHPGGVGPGGLDGLVLWLQVPVWLAALAALLRPADRGRRAVVAVTVAVVALTLAQVAVRTSLGVLPEGHAEAGSLVTVWPGTLLSLAGAGLVLAAAALVDELLGRRRPVLRLPARALGMGAAALVVAAPVAVAAGAAVAGRVDPGLTVAADPLPPVASEQARGPAAVRTLLLEPEQDGLLVDLQGAEPEPTRILRDRTVDLARGVPEQTVVEQAVSALVGGASADQAQGELLDLGVGYVQLAAADTHPVVDDLDRVSGLTRVSSPQDTVLWRMVEGDPARTRVVEDGVIDGAGDGGGDGDGGTVAVLPATGPHGQARGTVEVPEPASLRVAEGTGWSDVARVTVDGEELDLEAPGAMSLLAGRHTVEVTLPTPGLPWQLVALALAAVTAFLALPVGRTDPGPSVPAGDTDQDHDTAEEA
ncbi:Glycosyl transferase, family 2 [Serinicoccus hydrothermalis]|uniref:Glycosyl transferase, family 2 n=1 Tax=Serinicoccus hydrothermalis TaxID=1758689 RepID=A0A1B1NAG6_9MICO|nr:glycosyltransferase [Serinicoccus hydrothermalis]ANS78427.1 Glycosyl transferase, family 2 [Serinicoccus hydrothermalis]